MATLITAEDGNKRDFHLKNVFFLAVIDVASLRIRSVTFSSLHPPNFWGLNVSLSQTNPS